MTVAVLYCDPRGVYAGIDDLDLWDEKRDARLYAGPHPVVAHPPCGVWSMLAHLNQSRWGREVGDDGGCFSAALSSVLAFGGVLEHPAWSLAWDAHDLPRPLGHGFWEATLWDEGVWVAQIAQGSYGHPATKLTWLLYKGARPPILDLELGIPAPRALVSECRNHSTSDLPRVTKRAASATPLALALGLVELARYSTRRVPLEQTA